MDLTHISSLSLYNRHSHKIRYVHDPNDETFELSRVDAVALDVVTQSRFTINIYGYCGTSSLQEFANGDLKGLLPTLEPMEKLRYAAWVAQGVSDVHGVDVDVDEDEDEENRRSRGSNRTDAEKVVPFIHNDLNMDNILLGTRDGVEVPLLNDFNIAVFRKKDARTGEPCKFRGRFANPQVRLLQTSLSLVLFLLLNSLLLMFVVCFIASFHSGCRLSNKNVLKTTCRRDI